MDPEKPSPFLALPPELRNRIYEYTLSVENCTIKNYTIRNRRNRELPNHWARDFSKRWTRVSKPLVLAILQTCHQIHDEAQCIFYCINTLLIKARDIAEFLHATSARRLRAIRNLKVKAGIIDDLEEVLLLLKASITGLHTLHLQFDVYSYRTAFDGEREICAYYLVFSQGRFQSNLEMVFENAPTSGYVRLAFPRCERSIMYRPETEVRKWLQKILDRVRGKQLEISRVE